MTKKIFLYNIIGIEPIAESTVMNTDLSKPQSHINGYKKKQITKMTEQGLNFRDEKGRTSLIKACEEGLCDIVTDLVRKGADINAKDGSGRTPLMIALEKGNDNMAIMLISNGANFSALVNYNLLTSQFFKSHPHFIKFLSSNGMGGDSTTSQAIVIFTSEKEGINAIQAYIENGGHVNASNSDGQTCLMMAAEKGNEDAVKYLIEKKANLNLQDRRGDTALMHAVKKRNYNVTKLLLENNADVNIANKDGENALMEAARNNDVKMAQLVIDYDIKLDAENNKGQNALAIAAESGSLDTVKLLVEIHSKKAEQAKKENLENKDSSDNKQASATSDKQDTAAAKKTAKCSLNHQNKEGKTALMYAYESKNTDIFQYLLEKEADPLLKDKSGKSIMDMISQENNTEFKNIVYSTLANSKSTNLHIYNMREQLGILQKQSNDNIVDTVNTAAPARATPFYQNDQERK